MPVRPPAPVSQPAMTWPQPTVRELDNGLFEVTMPAHLNRFTTQIPITAAQVISIKYADGSPRGQLQYELAGRVFSLWDRGTIAAGFGRSTITLINLQPVNNPDAEPIIVRITLE